MPRVGFATVWTVPKITEQERQVDRLPSPSMMSKVGEGLWTAGVVWSVSLVLSLGVWASAETLIPDWDTPFILGWNRAILTEVVSGSIFDAITVLLVFAMFLPLLYSAQTSPRWRMPWLASLTVLRGAWVWFFYQIVLDVPGLAILAAQTVPFALGLNRMLATNNTDILGLPREAAVPEPGWPDAGRIVVKRLRSLSEFTRLALFCAAVLSCAHSLMASAVLISHSVAAYDFGVRFEEPPDLTSILLMPLIFLLPVWPLLLAPALFRRTRLKPENRKTALYMLVGAACVLALPMSILSFAGLDELFSSAPDAGQGIGIAIGVFTFGPSLFVAGFGALIGFIAARLR